MASRDSPTSSKHQLEQKSHKSKKHKNAKHRDDRERKVANKKNSKKESKKHKRHSDSKRHGRKERKEHKRQKERSGSESSSDSSGRKDKNHRTSSTKSVQLCPVISSPITADDYFTKNQEFRVWLKQFHHPSFESLTSKDAHHIFLDLFLPSYNSGSLPSYFYTGEFPIEMKHEALHTQHRWNIRLNPSEKDQLKSATDSVEALTSAGSHNSL